ncbi:MAG: hypothetical protein RMH77_04190 [Sulfolobales archaeon]|nr:hypothetical protein [Sulfolobales archaeon]MCX8185645.1 hypothetical protein [Sulfolobales archaeon]MDW7969588.1 hypothetical protein [Sulfolobales archaeon]
MNSSVRPIYGQGTFVVCENGDIIQEVIFDYVDDGLYYWGLLSNEEELDKELSKVVNNMQSFIDDEVVKINGRRVFPRVIGVDIGFRGFKSRPYITFYINFKGDLRSGVNVYEDTYESEYVDYDYTVTWVFTGSLKVLKAYLGVEYDVLAGGKILIFSISKGFNTPGYERIEFKL